jgi:hypothetical protein
MTTALDDAPDPLSNGDAFPDRGLRIAFVKQQRSTPPLSAEPIV